MNTGGFRKAFNRVGTTKNVRIMEYKVLPFNANLKRNDSADGAAQSDRTGGI